MEDQATKLRGLVEEMAGEEAAAQKIGELDLDVKEETRVIAVTSGKGGVGKTNLAVNLALALQASGKQVLLIDADIGMANVNVLMGRVTNRSLVDLLSENIELDDIVEDGLQGVKYISGVAGVEAALSVNRAAQRMIHRKLGKCSDLADIRHGRGLEPLRYRICSRRARSFTGDNARADCACRCLCGCQGLRQVH